MQILGANTGDVAICNWIYPCVFVADPPERLAEQEGWSYSYLAQTMVCSDRGSTLLLQVPPGNSCHPPLPPSDPRKLGISPAIHILDSIRLTQGNCCNLLLQDSRPTGTIPLAGNKVVRHPDESKQPSFKFEILG